jgi:phospholipase C
MSASGSDAGLTKAGLMFRLERPRARRRNRLPLSVGRARPEPTRPAGTDLIPQIRHIGVLMMQGHSYDNYLGTLQPGDGLTLSRMVSQPAAT